MGRKSKPVIAVNKDTEERKFYDSVRDCASDLGVSNSAVLVAVARGTAVKGWKLYDTPENIRQRIQELQSDLQFLENK